MVYNASCVHDVRKRDAQLILDHAMIGRLFVIRLDLAAVSLKAS